MGPRNRPVHMSGNDVSNLAVLFHDLIEVVAVFQLDRIHPRKADIVGRVMHEDRDPVGRTGQFRIQPGQPVVAQIAAIGLREVIGRCIQRIQEDQTPAVDIQAALHEPALIRLGVIEHRQEFTTIVMIAQQQRGRNGRPIQDFL